MCLLGRSKTTGLCNLNKYAEQDLKPNKSLMMLGDMPFMALHRTPVTQTLKRN